MSSDCNVPDGQLSGLLPSLVVALRYPLLIGFFLPIFILAVEIPAQETGASADGRAKARIAGDSPDESATGRTTSPASKRTLLGFTSSQRTHLRRSEPPRQRLEPNFASFIPH